MTDVIRFALKPDVLLARRHHETGTITVPLIVHEEDGDLSGSDTPVLTLTKAQAEFLTMGLIYALNQASTAEEEAAPSAEFAPVSARARAICEALSPSFGEAQTSTVPVVVKSPVTVSRSLPAIAQSARTARHLVWEVCDGIGIGGDRRTYVGLMVTELVVEALRETPAAITSYVLDITGALADGHPVLCVEFREVGLDRPPHRLLEHGRGLAIVRALGVEWPHHECGWLTPKEGPTSWFIVGDTTPEHARLLSAEHLFNLRGLENMHHITEAAVGTTLRPIHWGCDH
ncbi:hypothetical protein [Embleya sp. NPDC005971]|uniref:ATP-binding protein n=1 Tax=Embleya sp. NPDC005971 TaxID=3156724 RepID=UPI0033E3665F